MLLVFSYSSPYPQNRVLHFTHTRSTLYCNKEVVGDMMKEIRAKYLRQQNIHWVEKNEKELQSKYKGMYVLVCHCHIVAATCCLWKPYGLPFEEYGLGEGTICWRFD